MIRTVHWVCGTLLVLSYSALVLWLLFAPFMWILRDGLGPDAGETTGWAALRQFMPVLLLGQGIVVFTALMHLIRWLVGRRIRLRKILSECDSSEMD
jgi:hypothetical protein